jgi:hypothetical protein
MSERGKFRPLRRSLWIWGSVLAVLLTGHHAVSVEISNPLGPGDSLPEIVLSPPATAEESDYLNLAPKGSVRKLFGGQENQPVSPGRIDTDLLLIEFFNVYCASCNAQAPVMKEVFEAIQGNPNLRDRVKVLGIGAGNNPKEIAYFKENKQIPFPLFPDPHFEAYEAIGNPGGTPHMLITKKTQGGHVVAWVHTGLIRSAEPFVREVEEALRSDLATIKAKASERPAGGCTELDCKPELSEEELEAKVKASLLKPGETLISLSKATLPADEDIYVGKIAGETGELTLFAKVASRLPVCDLCHATHFILVFDEGGKVVGFTPLQVTKYGNEPWNETEILKMKGRLLGRSIMKPLEFDPKVDAVTSATMTSALIFDSVREAKETYAALEKEGYLKK